MILEAYKYIADNAEQTFHNLFYLEGRIAFQVPALINTKFFKRLQLSVYQHTICLILFWTNSVELFTGQKGCEMLPET